MKVVLVASPLAGLRPEQVCDAARLSWLESRPSDDVLALAVSDGVPAPYVGSGCEELLGMVSFVEIPGDPRRHAWVDESRVFLDYSSSMDASSPGTSWIGQDLAWASEREPREILLLLPRLGALSDLGTAALCHLAWCARGWSEPEPASWEALDDSQRAAVVADARNFLARQHVSVFVPAEQRLLGLSGVARAWMREGMAPVQAQKQERACAERARQIVRAVNAAPSRDLLGNPFDERGIYDGVGGGVALALRGLGARVLPVREIVGEALSQAEDADLLVYVCAAVGDDLPEGIHAARTYAMERGIPLVLVYDAGALRKGELAQLGINGAYELRPERAFEAGGETPESAAEIEERLRDMIARVARTWGW